MTCGHHAGTRGRGDAAFWSNDGGSVSMNAPNLVLSISSIRATQQLEHAAEEAWIELGAASILN